jgi:hypothetical protein
MIDSKKKIEAITIIIRDKKEKRNVGSINKSSLYRFDISLHLFAFPIFLRQEVPIIAIRCTKSMLQKGDLTVDAFDTALS